MFPHQAGYFKEFLQCRDGCTQSLPLEWLKTKHPRCGFYEECGKPLVFRLATDSSKFDESRKNCVVYVDHITQGETEPRTYSFDFSWNECPAFDADSIARCLNTLSSRTVTEFAAIGVMAILIWELEQWEVAGVIEQGYPGDYKLLSLPDLTESRVEVSGIEQADHLSQLTSRVRQKSRQLSLEGYVSVTAFDYGPEYRVQSVLKFQQGGTP